MADRTQPDEKSPTVDEGMSHEEKEELADQLEKFEGPDRREVRGSEKQHSSDPGVSHS
jgi:hypothetical protein